MVDIGIIGAMDDEVKIIVGLLEDAREEEISGTKFYTGKINSKNIAVAKCGVGKVFAAICAQTMILKYSPRLIVNTGVGGGIGKGISTLDVVIADRLCQHDMDTSPLGDPKGLISGINRVYFNSDQRAVRLLEMSAKKRNISLHVGVVATGDKFISSKEDAEKIRSEFSAVACEMEGGAIAHTAFVNNIPFVVIRAISDNADEGASLSYSEFLSIAVKNSSALTLDLIKEY